MIPDLKALYFTFLFYIDYSKISLYILNYFFFLNKSSIHLSNLVIIPINISVKHYLHINLK